MTSRNERHIPGAKYILPALAGAAALYIVQSIVPEPSPVSPLPTTTPLFEPSKDVLLAPETRELTLQLIGRYLNAKTQLQEVIQKPLTIDEVKVGTFAAEKMNQLAWQNLIDGLHLAKTIGLHNYDPVEISQDNKHAKLRGWDFSLENPLHFQIASSLITLELNNYALELQKQQILQDGRKDKRDVKEAEKKQSVNQKVIDNLFWLADKNPPIVIEQDAFTFLPTENIDNLSTLLRASREAGLPFPRKITYIRHKKSTPGGAMYYDHNQGNKAFTIEITNNSLPDDIIHEYGHFLSDATFSDQSSMHLKDVNQQAFEETINKAMNRYGKDIKDIRNTFLVVKKDNTPNLTEEYAEQFKQYFMNGRAMREKLYRLHEYDPAALEIEKTMYDFMEKAWNGREFSISGQELVRQYDIGTAVIIKDEDTYRPGVFIKPAVDSQLDPSFPVVFNGDRVEIIEGPVEMQERTFWRVRITNQTFESSRMVGYQYDKSGWISQEYLGESLR